MNKPLLLELLKTETSVRTIATKLGMSHQAVYNFCSRNHLAPLAKPVKEPKQPSKLKQRMDSFNLNQDLYSLASIKFSRKRQNVRNAGKWEFSVEFEDIHWPTHCPVLGLELLYNSPFDKKQEASVSFDRIDSSKGYVKENVHIISWRANRIKNDGTPEEHKKIYEFFTNLENS